jgi:hypothetical protein
MPRLPGSRAWLVGPGKARRVRVMRQVLFVRPAYRVRLLGVSKMDEEIQGGSLVVDEPWLTDQRPRDFRVIPVTHVARSAS